ncbi:MAG: 3-hydroxylacyl-ACP dehydratase [Kangiellaceae bacterium]
MKLNHYPIEHIVPHDHPMILVDELLEYDETVGVCKVTIHDKSNFYNSEIKGVPSYVALEYMAQSIAAYANANRIDQNQETTIGFLVSSRKFKVFTEHFDVTTELIIKVEQLYVENGGLASFDCKVERNNEIVSQAKINIFQPNDPQSFLAEPNNE